MIQATSGKGPGEIDALVKHIHGRTFGRLHNLQVIRLPSGRLHVSAIAHSRFVGQLAEWAVLERCSTAEVDLAIDLHLSPTQPVVTSPYSFEEQK